MALSGLLSCAGKNTTKRDLSVWLRAIGAAAIVFIVTPVLVYLAWPAAAQAPPSGVNGNCNVFGNNNTNCNTFNIVPKPGPRQLPPHTAKKISKVVVGKDLKVVIIAAGGEEPNAYANEIGSALSSGSAVVSGFL